MSRFLQEVKGFTPVIDVVVADVGFVTAGVYGVAWRYCQMSDHVCKVSQERMAGHLGISAKTVQRHLQNLCEAGYLKDLTPEAKNRPHVYADTGRVIITGLVEARLVGQKVQAGRTESPGHPDRESIEDSIDDSSYELPARPARGGDYFTVTEDPEYDTDLEEPRPRPKWQVPDTKFQRDFLAVCKAKRFRPKQKAKVKKLAKCLEIGEALSEVECLRRCLQGLQPYSDFPDKPIAMPNSWLCWRSDHAQSHRWSVQGFINSLFDRDALVRHCQIALKQAGGDSAAEESAEEYASRTGRTVYE